MVTNDLFLDYDIYIFKIFYLRHFYEHVCVCSSQRQLGPLLLRCGSQELISGHQAWQREALPKSPLTSPITEISLEQALLSTS